MEKLACGALEANRLLFFGVSIGSLRSLSTMSLALASHSRYSAQIKTVESIRCPTCPLSSTTNLRFAVSDPKRAGSCQQLGRNVDTEHSSLSTASLRILIYCVREQCNHRKEKVAGSRGPTWTWVCLIYACRCVHGAVEARPKLETVHGIPSTNIFQTHFPQ
jgi:hypothetical protein